MANVEMNKDWALYGSLTSPYVRHCRIALEQSGMAWRMVEVDGAASARRSPTKKVPYFTEGELLLSDSSSIVRYVREKSTQTNLQDIRSYDRYLLINTLLDSAINLFLLARDGCTPENSSYLRRQKSRLVDGLVALNQQQFKSLSVVENQFDDTLLRLVCFLDWGVYRDQICIEGLGQLERILDEAKRWPLFLHSAPPEA